MEQTSQLFGAIASGNQDQLETLLASNPSLVDAVDQRGFTPLIFATYFGNEAATRSLLSHNANIDATDATGNTALIGVGFKGDLNLAKILLESGSNINACEQNGDNCPKLCGSV